MLFETGFAVDKAQPATDPALLQGRKRKRGQQDGTGGSSKDEAVREAEVNLEKLMAKLRDAEKGSGANAASSKPTSDGAGAAWKKQIAANAANRPSHPASASEKSIASNRKHGKQPEKKPVVDTSTNGPPPAKPAAKKPAKTKSSEPYVPDDAALAKREARKLKQQRKEETSNAKADATMQVEEAVEPESEVESNRAEKVGSTSAMTDLQKSMQKKLGGARFRWINEQLVRLQPSGSKWQAEKAAPNSILPQEIEHSSS